MRSLLSRGTLRARLTMWYVLLLGLIALLFSGYLYLRLEGSLLDQVDIALQAAAAQVLPYVDEQHALPAFENSEGFHTAAGRLALGGFALRLVAPDGTLLGGLGSYPEVPGLASRRTICPTSSSPSTVSRTTAPGASVGPASVWRSPTRSLASMAARWKFTAVSAGAPRSPSACRCCGRMAPKLASNREP